MEQAEAAAQQQGGAYISARLRNPGDINGSKSRGSEPADKAGFVCALLATLILLAITAMLYLNWDLIKTA